MATDDLETGPDVHDADALAPGPEEAPYEDVTDSPISDGDEDDATGEILCENCQLTFGKDEDLKAHVAEMHPFQCPQCPEKRYKSFKGVQKHYRERHPNEEVFACKPCAVTFTKKTALKKHEREQGCAFSPEDIAAPPAKVRRVSGANADGNLPVKSRNKSQPGNVSESTMSPASRPKRNSSGSGDLSPNPYKKFNSEEKPLVSGRSKRLSGNIPERSMSPTKLNSLSQATSPQVSKTAADENIPGSGRSKRVSGNVGETTASHTKIPKKLIWNRKPFTQSLCSHQESKKGLWEHRKSSGILEARPQDL
jgi:hypothetical protein